MTNQPEMGLLDEAADWHSHTAWQGEPNVNQLKLEVDQLVETELEGRADVLPTSAPEAAPRPPAPGRRGLALARERLRDDILPIDQAGAPLAVLAGEVYAFCNADCCRHWLDDSQEGAALKEALVWHE